jgi:hypothetical protein
MIGLGIGVAWTFGKINRFVSNMILAFRMRVAADGGVFEAPGCLAAQLEELRKDQLLSSTSLVVTPSAYKAGILYDIVPNTALGDLNVVRATSATRVDANGLVEIPRTNLALRSEEFDISPWSTLGTITITPNATNSPSGNLTADLILGADSLSSVNQIISGTTGVVYTNSFYIKNNNSTQSRLTIRNTITAVDCNINWSGSILSSITNLTGTTTFQDAGNGWYRIISTYTAIEVPQRPRIIPTQTTNQSVYVWGAQLEQGVSATEYIPTVASIRTKFAGITQDGGSASNIPRLDYTNGSCPSILVEPQRTNNFTFSEQFDDASWTKTNATITANSTVSPSGNLTADTITNDIGTTGSILKQITVANNSDTYNSSFFVKKQSGFLVFQFRYLNGVTPVGCAIHFDKLTGAFLNVSASFGFTGTPVNIKVESYGDYFRFSYSLANNSTGNTILRIEIQPHRGTSLGNLSQTNGNAIMWGAQLELGANATSYIPTTSATVTRNADIISKTGISSLIGQTEGTLYWEGISQFPTDILGTNRSTANGIYITKGNDNLFRVFIYNSSNLITLNDTIIRNSNTKIAISYKSGNTSLFVNGVKVDTSLNSLTFNSSLDAIRLNDDYLIGKNSNFTKSVLVYKTQLTDAQLELLTGDSFYTYDEMAIALNYNIQ